MTTLAEIIDEIYDGNFSELDKLPENISEDDDNNLMQIFSVLIDDGYIKKNPEEERIEWAKKLIGKIGQFSDQEEIHYGVLSGIINYVTDDKNSIRVRIFKLMIESGKFDAGAVYEAGGEKKDLLEVASQQSVKESIRKQNLGRNFEEMNELYKNIPEESERDKANKAFVMILLKSGKVAGFEGEDGIEMAKRIEEGFSFRALAGRTIPDRDQSKIEAWLKNQSEDSLSGDSSSDEIEVRRSSSSILGVVVSAVCSCLSFSCLSPNSRYQNSSDRS